MDPLDPEPPGGDPHRHDRLLVWAATAGALACSALIFLATNSLDPDPDPVAEPAPTMNTALPLPASSTITTTTTTTTTTAAPTTTTPPPTTTRRTTTTRATTTTTTHRTTTTTTTTTLPPTTTHRCLAPYWRRDTAYNGGDVVAYDGRLWVAKWWSYNAIPDANAEGVWEFARDC